MLELVEKIEAAVTKMSDMLIDLRNIIKWRPSGHLSHGQALAKIMAMMPSVPVFTLTSKVEATRGKTPTVSYSATYYDFTRVGGDRYITITAGSLEDLVEAVRIQAEPPATVEQLDEASGFDFDVKEVAEVADAEMVSIPQA